MLQQFRRSSAAMILTVGAAFPMLARGIVIGPVAAPASAAQLAAPEPAGWILVDAGTGNVLDGRDIHTQRRTASMVKVMTALTALDHLPDTAHITVTQTAIDHGISNRDPSGMAVGQSWSLNATLGVLLVISANDAAYALANAVTPNVADFGAAESETAKRLGMSESTFNDPAGLDDTTAVRGGPTMSPFDVAISVRNARHVPIIAKWAATSTYSFTDPKGSKHTISNHNFMLPGLKFAYNGADGFKTGFTKNAGGTLVATATRAGRTLIAVVMQTADTWGWAAKKLDEGFAMPLGSAGTGERLPALAYRSVSQRIAQQHSFIALAEQPSGAKHVTSNTAAPTSYVVSTTTKTTQAPAAASKSSGGNGTLTVVIVVALLGATMIARRAQVKRQRTRRLAKRRTTQAAMRRGSLPVVDGKYRAGMRTGPPVPSNVRVRKMRDD